jgi:ketosteroid isomerase-like protein
MSNREWYDAIFYAVDSKDSAGFCDFLTDDAVFRWGAQPEVRGNAAIKGYVDGFLGMFEGTRHEVLETVESGEVRVVRGEVTYLLKDGREIPTPFCTVFHNGRRPDP